MSTTTIRLPDELKARITQIALQAGTSAHNFIVQAVADKAAQAEAQLEFEAQAHQRFQTLASSGKTLAWADVRGHLQARIAALSTAPVATETSSAAHRPPSRKHTK